MEAVMHMLLCVVAMIAMIGVISQIGAPVINIMKFIGNETSTEIGAGSYAAIEEPYPTQSMINDTSIIYTLGTVISVAILYDYASGPKAKQPRQILIKPQKPAHTIRDYNYNYANITSATPVTAGRFARGGMKGTKLIKRDDEKEKMQAALRGEIDLSDTMVTKVHEPSEPKLFNLENASEMEIRNEIARLAFIERGEAYKRNKK